MADILDELSNLDDESLEGKAPPSAKVVEWLHANASTREVNDIHHRTGTNEADASPGNHTHNGRDSYALFDSDAIPADLAGAATLAQTITAVNSILALLRTKGD